MGWNVIDDALNALDKWFRGIVADGIIGSLQNTCDTLNATFSGNNPNLIKGFLQDTPDKFTGTLDGTGTPIWNGIEKITNQAIVPVAMFILVVVLVYELIQMVVSGNNFRDFDTGIFMKWTVKAVCGILLVSNVFYIATSIFAFGSDAVTKGLGSLFPASGKFLGDGASLNADTLKIILTGDNFDRGSLVVLLILSFLIMIITFVVLGAIIIVLASRIIEVFMYLSIAPIPMATMMNRDWGEIGKSWLRNILALAFQGFFIVVALTIFKVLLLNVINEMTAIAPATLPSGSAQNTVTAATITGSMTMIFGYIVALIFTIFRSSNIAKSVFSAH